MASSAAILITGSETHPAAIDDFAHRGEDPKLVGAFDAQ
jgi:hypothetical protein